jgi:hypothetical protein
MSKNTIFVALFALAVAGGMYYYVWGGLEPLPYPEGRYPYNCNPALQISLAPTADFSSILVEPFAGADFPPVASFASDDSYTGPGAKYMSGEMTLVGQGEKVTLTSGTTAYECYPMPSVDEAPINFGD